ncbi:hypothetical protein BJX68DRAFT_160810 [Aspergillus pseudodeflectus]|uniref:Uncharacterized protein n=1 Tax=Aspergillus pseudodeflectus TaxID=176178 RepID=A0ABR4L3S4_9EURO
MAMDSEYPPLPSTETIANSLRHTAVSDKGGVANSLFSGRPVLASVAESLNVGGPDLGSQTTTRVIAESGDIFLEYESPTTGVNGLASYRWRVDSESLMQSSPYFCALLDPNKFSEGKHLMRQRELYSQGLDSWKHGGNFDSSDYAHVQDYALPTIRLPNNHPSYCSGLDTIELFLRILSYHSFNEEEQESFSAEIRGQRPSSIAKLIELADAYNSTQAVYDTLGRCNYTLGRPKLPLTKFNSSVLRLSEDRIRQSIFVASFVNERTIFQILTHALIVSGSKFWVSGIEGPDPDTPKWQYLPDGLEEELYYRRQCVLNTITDLQAHFLRVFGAIEEHTVPTKPNIPNQQTKPYQCRCGLGNSSACDAFHLGQMTRFFALRTKTIFLGSTLIDPDFNPDVDENENPATAETLSSERSLPPADITALISSLKQCPDYQIDSNHTACGIRRRFLPSLDCIEGFVGDERGLLGVNMRYWRRGEAPPGGPWPQIHGSWANRAHRRALAIDIRLSRISGVPNMSRGMPAAELREEDARLLFTAKKRNWEAS